MCQAPCSSNVFLQSLELFPPGISDGLFTGATGQVPVRATVWTETLAVLRAEQLEGNRQQNGLPNIFMQVYDAEARGYNLQLRWVNMAVRAPLRDIVHFVR